MSVKNFYRNTAKVYSKTTDEDFSTNEAWSYIKSVECDVDAIPVSLRYVQGNGKTMILDATMYTEDLTIEQGNRVKIDSDILYDVVLVDKPRDRHSEITLSRCPEGVTV